MTRLLQENETCSICGHISEQIGIMSTNRLHAPDIDCRPPEMERSTMPYWMRRCPSCGYCAPHLSSNASQVSQIIQSGSYQQQLRHESNPELANSFLCSSMIQEQTGDYPLAGWHALYAAWTCDDAGAGELAVLARQKALQHFQEARARHIAFAKDIGIEEVVIADLLRRLGQFGQVEPVCQEGVDKLPGKIVREMLEAQIFFSGRQDADSYNLGKAKEVMGVGKTELVREPAQKPQPAPNKKWWQF